jgi:hypothetical protein
MSRFIPVDRQTDYLLPPSVDEWLPDDGHLARFVVAVVEPLDLSALTRRYAGRGHNAHHPAVLLSLLVYGYATGVYASRKTHRLKTQAGRALYALRKHTVEPVFGIIKHVMAFGSFHYVAWRTSVVSGGWPPWRGISSGCIAWRQAEGATPPLWIGPLYKGSGS